MPQAGGGGQQSEGDNSLAALWITIGIFALFGFIWYFYSTYIIAFVVGVRYYELKFVSFFVPYGWSDKVVLLQNYIHLIQSGNIPNLTFEDLLNLSNQVGWYLKYPTIFILMGLAVVVYVAHVTFRYKKSYSMKNLVDREKETWPQILPIAQLDLMKEKLDKGPWAMALSPTEFARKHNLIIEEKLPPDPSKLMSKIKLEAGINRDEARKVFAMQLGHYWSSPEALPIHARALFAAFAARINGDGNSSALLLTQISRSSASGRLNFSGTNELLAKYKDKKLVKNIIKNHAFVLTVMASMIEIAREDGVLPSSDFLWLKPVDRRLWYMMNSVGRQTAFAEVAGPFAHWLVEKELKRRLNIPMVEEAVNALEAGVKELIYKPVEEEDN